MWPQEHPAWKGNQWVAPRPSASRVSWSQEVAIVHRASCWEQIFLLTPQDAGNWLTEPIYLSVCVLGGWLQPLLHSMDALPPCFAFNIQCSRPSLGVCSSCPSFPSSSGSIRFSPWESHCPSGYDGKERPETPSQQVTEIKTQTNKQTNILLVEWKTVILTLRGELEGSL